MFTILFVALFLGSGLVMIVVLTSVGVWQRCARATELQHCTDRHEVTMSPSWPLQSPLHPSSWTPRLARGPSLEDVQQPADMMLIGAVFPTFSLQLHMPHNGLIAAPL